jgi:hypothetical protein
MYGTLVTHHYWKFLDLQDVFNLAIWWPKLHTELERFEMAVMWNGNNIKCAAQICITIFSLHHRKEAVTLLRFYSIYIKVSVTCLTRSVVYLVYTYEYIFVSPLVLNTIVLLTSSFWVCWFLILKNVHSIWYFVIY